MQIKRRVAAFGGSPLCASQRLGGSIAAALSCAANGADVIRVHDVQETVQALAYVRCLQRSQRAWQESSGGASA